MPHPFYKPIYDIFYCSYSLPEHFLHVITYIFHFKPEESALTGVRVTPFCASAILVTLSGKWIPSPLDLVIPNNFLITVHGALYCFKTGQNLEPPPPHVHLKGYSCKESAEICVLMTAQTYMFVRAKALLKFQSSYQKKSLMKEKLIN